MPSLKPLLTDPDRFFAAREDDYSYRGPLLVVTAAALVTAVSLVFQIRGMYSVIEAMGIDTGEIPTAIITGFVAVMFLTSLIGPYIQWLLWAGAFQLVSVFLDGTEDFSATLAFTGWGYVPLVVNSALAAAINYYRFQVEGVSVPTNMTEEEVVQYVQTLAQGEYVVLTTAFSVLFTLWSVYIWFYGVKRANDLSRRDAAISVGIPLLIALAFQARTLLVAL